MVTFAAASRIPFIFCRISFLLLYRPVPRICSLLLFHNLVCLIVFFLWCTPHHLLFYCCNKQLVICITVSSRVCFAVVDARTPSLGYAYVVILVSRFAIRWYPCIQSPWMMSVPCVDQSNLVFHAEIQESFATSIDFPQSIVSGFWCCATAAHFGIEITHYHHYFGCWYLIQRFWQCPIEPFHFFFFFWYRRWCVDLYQTDDTSRFCI